MYPSHEPQGGAVVEWGPVDPGLRDKVSPGRRATFGAVLVAFTAGPGTQISRVDSSCTSQVLYSRRSPEPTKGAH